MRVAITCHRLGIGNPMSRTFAPAQPTQTPGPPGSLPFRPINGNTPKPGLLLVPHSSSHMFQQGHGIPKTHGAAADVPDPLSEVVSLTSWSRSSTKATRTLRTFSPCLRNSVQWPTFHPVMLSWIFIASRTKRQGWLRVAGWMISAVNGSSPWPLLRRKLSTRKMGSNAFPCLGLRNGLSGTYFTDSPLPQKMRANGRPWTQNYPFPKKRWNRPRIWLRPLLCLVWRWLMLEHLLQVCSTWLLAARPKRRLKVAHVRWRWLCWVGEEKGWHWHFSVLTAYFWDWCPCFPLSQEDECRWMPNRRSKPCPLCRPWGMCSRQFLASTTASCPSSLMLSFWEWRVVSFPQSAQIHWPWPLGIRVGLAMVRALFVFGFPFSSSGLQAWFGFLRWWIRLF